MEIIPISIYDINFHIFLLYIQLIEIYICSMIGAFICGVGYYTVLWGQIKDEEINKLDDRGKNSFMDEKVPLLQDQDSQV